MHAERQPRRPDLRNPGEAAALPRAPNVLSACTGAARHLPALLHRLQRSAAQLLVHTQLVLPRPFRRYWRFFQAPGLKSP